MNKITPYNLGAQFGGFFFFAGIGHCGGQAFSFFRPVKPVRPMAQKPPTAAEPQPPAAVAAQTLPTPKPQTVTSFIRRALQFLYEKACFTAGTLLLTPSGSRPIESFAPGDLVLSRNEHDIEGFVEPKVVEEVFVRLAKVVQIHIGEHVIGTTAEHPFWVVGKGWRPAREVITGDRFVGHDGQTSVVTKVVDTDQWATVYNLRVADFHTYFVGCDEWGFSVWAHNACVVPLDAAELAANPGKTFKVVDGANVTYHANAVEAHLAATPITGAAHPGAALRQAYAAVNQSGLSVAEKTALLRGHIRNIESQFGHTGWQLAAEEIGTDGSVIFSGQAGEAVVISPTGQLFTGSIRPNAPGFTWGPRGELTPVYTNLTPR